MSGSTSNASARHLLSSVSAVAQTRLDTLSIGALGADSRQAVVLEIGNVLSKVGFAGEFEPRAIIRSDLIEEDGHTSKINDTSYSDHEFSARLLKFFKYIFYKCLLTAPKDRRVIIVESVLASTSWRNTVAKILFQTFDVPSVLFAPSHLLATCPFGVSTALVIDVGYYETTVVPILDGVTMLYQLEASSIGAKRLEDRVHELLSKYGKVILTDGSERNLNENDHILMKTEAVAEDIVVRFCFATKISRGKKIQELGFNPEGDDIPHPPHDIHLPLGENTLKVPGLIREWAAEILFEYNENMKSLAQLVFDVVMRSPVDSRRILLESLILVGGVTRIRGFYHRLQNEIADIFNQELDYQLGGIDSIKFFTLPNSSIELYTNWLGGSMFGALDVLPYRSLTRENWLSNMVVPDWVTNVHVINDSSVKAR